MTTTKISVSTPIIPIVAPMPSIMPKTTAIGQLSSAVKGSFKTMLGGFTDSVKKHVADVIEQKCNEYEGKYDINQIGHIAVSLGINPVGLGKKQLCRTVATAVTNAPGSVITKLTTTFPMFSSKQ